MNHTVRSAEGPPSSIEVAGDSPALAATHFADDTQSLTMIRFLLTLLALFNGCLTDLPQDTVSEIGTTTAETNLQSFDKNYTQTVGNGTVNTGQRVHYAVLSDTVRYSCNFISLLMGSVMAYIIVQWLRKKGYNQCYFYPN